MSFSRLCFALLFCAILGPLAAREPTLVGDWRLADAPNNLHYSFQTNGIFRAYNIVDEKETLVISSKWRIEDDGVIFYDMTLPVYNRDETEYKFSFQSESEMTLVDAHTKAVTHWRRTVEPTH
jgi:hypothetical protein